MVTLTYAELGAVIMAAAVVALVMVGIAQAFGSDDAIRSIASQLLGRLRTKGFRIGRRTRG